MKLIKSIFLISLFVFAHFYCVLAVADVMNTNYISFTYDERGVSAEDLEGNPFPTEDVIEYEMYRTLSPIVDRQNSAVHTLVGTVSSPTIFVNIPDDDVTYAYGVRAKRTTNGGATELYSLINWSDVNGLSTPNPFLYKYPETADPKVPMGFAGS